MFPLHQAPDSGGTVAHVREEDIMTEIAGELDCSTLIEEPEGPPPPPVKQEKTLKKEEEMRPVKGGKTKSKLLSIKQEMDLGSIDVKREPVEESPEFLQGKCLLLHGKSKRTIIYLFIYFSV